VVKYRGIPEGTHNLRHRAQAPMITHACKRCKGDLYLERDEFGNIFLHCLQCGATWRDLTVITNQDGYERTYGSTYSEALNRPHRDGNHYKYARRQRPKVAERNS